VVILDKNHPPNALNSTYDRICEICCDSKINLEFILLTQKSDPYTLDSHTYPFSFEFMLACLKRVDSRKTHLTLPGGSLKSTEIVFSFINFFRDFDIQSIEADHVLQIEFVKEKQQEWE